MTVNALVIPPPNNSKKNIRNAIKEKLAISLADYRSIIGEKKFEAEIRKTAKRLGQNVAKALPKKPKKTKKIKTEKAL